jgi:8-oxo-dGTP diphosphatase
LGRELPSRSYTDLNGRAKTVRYWEMEPLHDEAAPRNEVDEIRWLPPDKAEELLTYGRDVDVLRAFERR